MSLGDLHHIRALREKEAWLFDAVPSSADGRRIVLYSMDPWQLGVFEQFLHLAFAQKGHRPVSIYYDGLLPITAWENASIPAPPLEQLRNRAEFIYRCFGIEPVGISRYREAAPARRQAEELVSGLKDADLVELSYRGLPIGRIAARDLFQYTLGCFEPSTLAHLALYRAHLVHAVMSVDLAHAILDRESPDIVILANGKSVMYSYMYEAARRRGVQVTTWEEGIYFDTSVVLANNDRAIDFPFDAESWQALKRRPFTPAEAEAVDQYFGRWRRQEATHYVYYDREDRNVETILAQLGIPADARLIALFPNIVWDTNALGKDRAFDGMLDWMTSTIRYMASRPDRYLIIRAHPGEVRLTFKTRTPVKALLESRFGRGLPSNVRIIGPESQFSSYEIGRRAERSAVYTSTLGIELSLMGLSPLVCGAPFYADRGFTHDVASREEYFELLDGTRTPRPPDLDLLRRFMHAVIFRLVKRPEFFVGIHGHPQQPRVQVESFEGFPESMPIFNGIVESILADRSFVTLDPEAAPCPA